MEAKEEPANLFTTRAFQKTDVFGKVKDEPSQEDPLQTATLVKVKSEAADTMVSNPTASTDEPPSDPLHLDMSVEGRRRSFVSARLQRPPTVRPIFNPKTVAITSTYHKC